MLTFHVERLHLRVGRSQSSNLVNAKTLSCDPIPPRANLTSLIFSRKLDRENIHRIRIWAAKKRRSENEQGNLSMVRCA